MSKVDTRLKIIKAVFSLEASKGNLKWTVADVARKSKVSRQTIYQNFGQSKKDILLNALREICEEYYGLTEERTKLASKDLIQSALLTRELYNQTPQFTIFYQTWRKVDSPYKAIFEQIEKSYQQRLIRLKIAKNDLEALGIHVIMNGLITAPFMSDDDFVKAFTYLISSKAR